MKKKSKVLLAVSGVAVLASAGAVFASNVITLNGGGAIEFGAGQASTSACDNDITTSLQQTYDPYTNDGAFVLSSIVVSGISDACNGRTIQLTVVGASGAGICSVDGTNAYTTPVTNGDIVPAGYSGFSVTGVSGNATVTLTVQTGCASTDVSKIAIATSANNS